MTTDSRSRPARIDAAVLVLAATHAFVIHTAIESDWELGTVAWLYWCANFIFGATVFLRMLKAHGMDLSELIAFFVGFGFLQGYAAKFTYLGTGPLRWDLDIAVALLGVLASQLLEMRAALAIDYADPPRLVHFTILGVARVIPLALMVALSLTIGDWIANGPFTYLMVFLLAVAAVDMAMQVKGRTIGRESAVL